MDGNLIVMTQDPHSDNRSSWSHYDVLIKLSTGLAVVTLTCIYTVTVLLVENKSVEDFLKGIITSSISTLILIFLSYQLLKSAESSRASDERISLIDDIAEAVAKRLQPDIKELADDLFSALSSTGNGMTPSSSDKGLVLPGGNRPTIFRPSTPFLHKSI